MVEINYWAVFFAGLSTMVVGAVWYSPGVFGNAWMKLAKVKPGKMTGGESAKLYGLALLASLVTAYVLAHVTFMSAEVLDHSFFQAALSTGFWLWLGFTAARMLTHYLFEGRPVQLISLNIAHEFVTIIVMALIIGLMGA